MSALISKFNIINEDNINEDNIKNYTCNNIEFYMFLVYNRDKAMEYMKEKIIEICDEYTNNNILFASFNYDKFKCHVYSICPELTDLWHLSYIYEKIYNFVDNVIIDYIISSDKIKDVYYKLFKNTSYKYYNKPFNVYYLQFVPEIYEEFKIIDDENKIHIMVKYIRNYNKICETMKVVPNKFDDAQINEKLLDDENMTPYLYKSVSRYNTCYEQALKKIMDNYYLKKIYETNDDNTLIRLLVQIYKWIPLKNILMTRTDYIIPIMINCKQLKLKNDDKKIVYEWLINNTQFVINNSDNSLIILKNSIYENDLRKFISNYHNIKSDIQIYKNITVNIKSDFDNKNTYDRSIIDIVCEDIENFTKRMFTMNYEPELLYYIKSFEEFYNTRYTRIKSKINPLKSNVTIKLDNKIITRNIDETNILLVISKMPNITAKYLHTILCGKYEPLLDLLLNRLEQYGDINENDGKFTISINK